MPRGRYRAIGDGFCSVKVKLTKRLAVGAGLLGSAHSMARRPVRRGEIVTQGGVKQVWSSRGEGGPLDPCAKRSAPTREGFLRALPLLPREATNAGLKIDASVQVYSCDPHSPWRRHEKLAGEG